jgi:1-acyl-sn-glycerol-3-phosphate acyltransferase
MKWIAKLFFKLAGWKINPVVPKEANRCMMIAAPHTSNWDYIYMRIGFFVLDIPMRVAIKDFWTKFPFGLIFKPLGALGIDRSPKKEGEDRPSYTQQMANFFKVYDRIAIVIAPEGTRSKRTEWKMGFYHAAKLAGVPITFGYLDYDKKEAGVGGVIYPTDDMEADMKKIMDFYSTITPKKKEKYSLDLRYAEKETLKS